MTRRDRTAPTARDASYDGWMLGQRRCRSVGQSCAIGILLWLSALGLGGRVGAQSWTRVPLVGPRAETAVVTDLALGRLLITGGQTLTPTGAIVSNAVTERRGSRLTQRGVGLPMPLTSHAIAYDEQRGRLVVFGGRSGAMIQGSTWEWDGVTWLTRAAGASPPARQNAGMVYDPIRQRTVLFGGANTTTQLEDTWEWDGVVWRQMPSATRPSARAWPGMVFDPITRSVLLFGGYANGPGAMADTWQWDGTQWSNVSPTTSPAPRWQHGMATDATTGTTVLFGGADAGFQGLNDTWVWNGSTWTQRTPATQPSPRIAPAMGWDPALARVVLVGGTAGTALPGSQLADAWSWDGSNWAPSIPGPAPAPRLPAALAYDTIRQRAVMVGQLTFAGTTMETWEWTGDTWQQAHPAQSPPPRQTPALAYDAARQRTVMFSGDMTLAADTWLWNGSNWAAAAPAVSPPARARAAMAYDAARQRVVLFGGRVAAPAIRVVDDTWEWDGANWRQLFPTTPPPARDHHAMAYDPIRQRVVMFGGTTTAGLSANDVWEWDGSNWALTPAAGTIPVARVGHAMAFDAASGRVVLFGGDVATATGGLFTVGGTYEWDGASWSQTGSATPSNSSGMAFDPRYARLVRMDANTGETWVYGRTAAATSSLDGSGCGAPHPGLAADAPSIGNSSFSLDLTRGLPNAPCAFALSPTRNPVQLGPCTLYLQQIVVVAPGLTTRGGTASLGLPLPINPSLKGQTWYAQAFVADPSGGFAGITFTPGLRLTFGD